MRTQGIILLVSLTAAALADDTNLIPVVEVDTEIHWPEMRAEIEDVVVPDTPEQRYTRIELRGATNAKPYAINELPVDRDRFVAMLRKLETIDAHRQILIKPMNLEATNDLSEGVALVREQGLTNISVLGTNGLIEHLK